MGGGDFEAFRPACPGVHLRGRGTIGLECLENPNFNFGEEMDRRIEESGLCRIGWKNWKVVNLVLSLLFWTKVVYVCQKIGEIDGLLANPLRVMFLKGPQQSWIDYWLVVGTIYFSILGIFIQTDFHMFQGVETTNEINIDPWMQEWSKTFR